MAPAPNVLPLPPVPPTRPTSDPTTTLLLTQLIQAQNQNNLLQAQAREDERRSRIELVPTKFPRLNCLSQETISSWYQRVLGVIQQPKYSIFYDPISHDLVPDGTINTTLNTILYSELLSSFSAPIQEFIYSRAELQNDGIALIRDLYTTYQQSWTQVQKDNHLKTWINIRQKNTETLQDYFARCSKLRQLSLDNGIPCSEDDLRHRFIMGLPALYTSIQEQAHDLPDPWLKPIHQLPSIAENFRDLKQSIRALHRANRGETTTPSSNPQSHHPRTNSSPNTTNNSQQQSRPPVDPIIQQRQNEIYSDIMAGTFHISKYIN